MQRTQREARDASRAASLSQLLLPAQAGYLEPISPLSKTYNFSQHAMTQAVDVQSASKVWSDSQRLVGVAIIIYI